MQQWARNIERTARLADAVCALCSLGESDYEHYVARRVGSIAQAPVREALREFSADFGDALACLEKDLAAHRANKDVPEVLRLSKINLAQYAGPWQKRVLGECRDPLDALGAVMGQLRDDIRDRLRRLWAEDDGAYSSYSDYSDSDTESETDDDDKKAPSPKEDCRRNRKRSRQQIANTDTCKMQL